MKGVVGSIYVDDMQVEDSSAPSNYNLVGAVTEWTMLNDFSYITEYLTADAQWDAICMIGSPDRDVSASLAIPINKSSATTYMISAWAAGYSVPQVDNKEFKAIASIYYSGQSTPEIHEFDFQTGLNSGEQYLSEILVPKHTSAVIEQIVLELSYAYNASSVYFYDIALVEESAQTYRYKNGNLIAVNQTSTASISSVYDDADRLESQAQNNENYTYTYKETGNTRLVDSVTSDGVTVSFTYDSAGNVTGSVITNVSDAKYLSSSTTYTTDKNFVSSVTDSTNASTYYTYNNRGLLISTENAKGTQVQYDYDAGNDRQVISYISGIVSASYEYLNGSLATIVRGGYIDGNSTKQNQEYSFEYDSFGNVTKVKVGNYTLVTYVYAENNGNLLQTVYGNGMVIENVYDILDRITEIKYNNVTRYRYSYNGNGDLARVEDIANDTVFTYEYDSLNRLHASYTTIGDTIDSISRYAYDSQNRVSVYHCGLSGVVGGTLTQDYTYAYNDTNGTLASMDVVSGAVSDGFTYNYDALQRLTSATVEGSHITLAETYGYRTISGNRTTNQISSYAWTSNGSTAVEYEYTYDAVGNITQIKQDDAVKYSYTYDEQNQLLTETQHDNGIRYEYTYDTYGNIRSVKKYSTTSGALLDTDTYSYGNSSWLDRLTAFNGTSITYDGMGNPLSYNNGLSYTFTWDGRELASVLRGGVTTSYTYGADGLRTKKQHGSTTYNYYYVDGRLVRMTWINSYIDFLYDESGEVYSIVYDGTQYYFVKNLQGDVVQIRSVWGTKLVEYEYDAWGNCEVVYSHSSYGDLAEFNPIRYRGYYYDFETGFYYLQSRYYDPQMKRFINEDDVSLLGANSDFASLNLYAYCGNNPVARADDGGEFWHIVAGAVIGTVTNVAIQMATNILTGEKWYDGIGISAASGALSGALAATGAGPVVQVIVNAVISGAGNFVSQGLEYGFDNIDYGQVANEAIVGGVTSAGNGLDKGTAKHLMREGINATKNVFSKGLKKTVKYYTSQTASMFYKPLIKDSINDFLKSTSSDVAKSHAKKIISEIYE